MTNFNETLDTLNFHDSYLHSIHLSDLGILTLAIIYYNWEENAKHSELWKSKKMVLTLEHVVVFSFHSPGLSMEDQEIHSAEALDKHQELLQEVPTIEKERNTTLQNTMAYQFSTHSYGSPIFGSSKGLLKIAGYNAKITWGETEIHSPKHIPAG